MRTDYLKTAINLLQHKTAHKAANAEFITYQALIDRIDALETELGFNLFKRSKETNRRCFSLPTDQGVVFLLWASQALAMLEEGRLEAVEGKGKVV